MDVYHQKHIAHRDIKPENILVDMSSPNRATKIIDFGFAAQSKAKMCVFCGTPAYMSPEICNKQKYDGTAADIWASGILLFTMLFGYLPFKASSENELFRKIGKGAFKMPTIGDDGRFTSFPSIDNAALIKDLLEDILKADEKERITAMDLQIKYKSIFNS